MENYSQSRDYTAGVIGGLLGGIVFGAVLGYLGVLPIIAGLVGSDSSIAGFVVHLVLSVLVGLVFVWWFGNMVASYLLGASYGLLHGFIWWILGGLIILPMVLGMGIQIPNAFNQLNLASLAGHLLYGLVLGLVYVYVTVERPHFMEHAHR